MNTMRIADLVFELDQVALEASIQDGWLVWSLSIAATPQDVHGELWRPRAYSESLIEIEGVKLTVWNEAFEHELCWTDGFNEKARRPNASLFVFEHTEIYRSTLKIKAEPTGAFEITWRAKCDVFFDPYQNNLDLEINASGMWEGVVVGSRGEKISADEASQRLKTHIKEGLFEFCPALDEHEHPFMRLIRPGEDA
ncbi:MAG: hypothetical protein JNM65_08515 [Verrucomicrobiaceae bacterium]|nr:hypothetical protein [Verrucomicrobiaceae bacterium]